MSVSFASSRDLQVALLNSAGLPADFECGESTAVEIDGGAASSAAPTNVPVEVVIFSLEKLLTHATTYLAEAADLRLRVAELMGVNSQA